MKTEQLVYVGIKGTVIALNRATGQQVWATHLIGSSFVNVVVEGSTVLASCRGEVFSLDPLTGAILWGNALRGFGLGLATLAISGAAQNNNTLAMAEKRRRDEEASSGTAGATATF